MVSILNLVLYVELKILLACKKRVLNITELLFFITVIFLGFFFITVCIVIIHYVVEYKNIKVSFVKCS